jgi:hypothetical protein
MEEREFKVGDLVWIKTPERIRETGMDTLHGKPGIVVKVDTLFNSYEVLVDGEQASLTARWLVREAADTERNNR